MVSLVANRQALPTQAVKSGGMGAVVALQPHAQPTDQPTDRPTNQQTDPLVSISALPEGRYADTREVDTLPLCGGLVPLALRYRSQPKWGRRRAWTAVTSQQSLAHLRASSVPGEDNPPTVRSFIARCSCRGGDRTRRIGRTGDIPSLSGGGPSDRGTGRDDAKVPADIRTIMARYAAKGTVRRERPVSYRRMLSSQS